MKDQLLNESSEDVEKLKAGIKPPIIVDEHGTAMVFESTEDAELYIEPIDVTNEEYVAYDSEGRLLKLIASKPQIAIESDEVEPNHSRHVRHLLSSMLEHAGIPSEILEKKSLGELVEMSLEYKTK